MIDKDVTRTINVFWARRGNYDIHHLAHRSGRYYDVGLNGRDYIAVVLPSSFQFWQLRYHLADVRPDLCICLKHDSVLPIPCLSLDAAKMSTPYAVPERIKNLKEDRWSKVGAQVLLSLYLLGVHSWVVYVEKLPPTTRKRYMARAKELSKRPVKGGRPVGLERSSVKRRS